MNTKKQIISISNPLEEIEADILKIKILSSKEIRTSLDRLTRFKPPLFNQKRVNESLITRNLIYPKLNLRQIQKLKQQTVSKLAEIIWNTSIKEISNNAESNEFLNIYLAYEEIKTFSSQVILDELVIESGILSASLPQKPTPNFIKNLINKLTKENLIYPQCYIQFNDLDIYDEIYINIKDKFDISNALEYIESKKLKELPENIVRLISLNNLIKNNNWQTTDINKFKELYELQTNQIEFSFGFPAKLLILVEGATEEKLLPLFASKQGVNFNKKGIKLIAPGGKNPTLKYYNEIKEKLNIPVFILLDADAVDIKKDLEYILRPQDTLYLIPEGEFEDILSKKLICKSINRFYKSTGSINDKELNTQESMAPFLYDLWRKKGFGEFNKAKFADILSENINDRNDITARLEDIIKSITKCMKT